MKLTTKEHRLVDALARETRYTIRILEKGKSEYTLMLGFYDICGLQFIIHLYESVIIKIIEVRSIYPKYLMKIQNIVDLIGTAQEGDF